MKVSFFSSFYHRWFFCRLVDVRTTVITSAAVDVPTIADVCTIVTSLHRLFLYYHLYSLFHQKTHQLHLLSSKFSDKFFRSVSFERNISEVRRVKEENRCSIFMITSYDLNRDLLEFQVIFSLKFSANATDYILDMKLFGKNIPVMFQFFWAFLAAIRRGFPLMSMWFSG